MSDDSREKGTVPRLWLGLRTTKSSQQILFFDSRLQNENLKTRVRLYKHKRDGRSDYNGLSDFQTEIVKKGLEKLDPKNLDFSFTASDMFSILWRTYHLAYAKGHFRELKLSPASFKEIYQPQFTKHLLPSAFFNRVVAGIEGMISEKHEKDIDALEEYYDSNNHQGSALIQYYAEMEEIRREGSPLSNNQFYLSNENGWPFE